MAKQIAFLALRQRLIAEGYTSRVTSPGWELYLIHEDGSHLRQVSGDHNVSSFRWSPDGQHLLCQSQRMGESQPIQVLSVLDADGTHWRHVLEEKRGVIWSWSPDGRHVAVTCFEVTNRSPLQHGSLHLLDLERGERRQITNELAYPVWSRETKDLAFLWSQDDTHLYALDADGTNRRLLFESPGLAGGSAWSPDGRHVVVGNWTGDELFLLRADGTPALQWERATTTWTWSPDSQQLALLAEDQEVDFQTNLSVLGVTGAAPEQLVETSHDAHEIGVAWSPDSQRIAFVGHEPERPYTYTLGVVRADGQPV
jgi:Tol biopolymer transport system component